MADVLQALRALHFGRVDAETDYRLETCFVGTEMLRQALQPQHSLFVGAKGSGKSALFKLLCNNLAAWKPLMPKGYEVIYRIPATGLQSERYLSGVELAELSPTTVNDFRDFWLLYVGLKTATTLVEDPKMQEIVSRSANPKVKSHYAQLVRVVRQLGLIDVTDIVERLKQRLGDILEGESAPPPAPQAEVGKLLAVTFRNKTGIAIIRLLDIIDALLQDTQCMAWVLFDKLDLLYFDNPDRLKTAVTGLVQLLVEYSDRFRNMHFKVFLRRDLYRQLRIVNKSHLVSYMHDMRWRGPWLIKLIVARAVSEQAVSAYCEAKLGEPVNVASVINGTDEYVRRVFYVIFEPRMERSRAGAGKFTTHEWILRRLVDGLGMRFPREIIHLANLASAQQREFARSGARPPEGFLVSAKALREAFEEVSAYRCETYLLSEFPDLLGHFDALRGKKTSSFRREELAELFADRRPAGEEAIRVLHDIGLLSPVGGNVDAADRFSIPLLYRSGLGIGSRRDRAEAQGEQEKSQNGKPDMQRNRTPEHPQLPFAESQEGAQLSPQEEEANIPSSHYRLAHSSGS
jgi:hypothetical protein